MKEQVFCEYRGTVENINQEMSLNNSDLLGNCIKTDTGHEKTICLKIKKY